MMSQQPTCQVIRGGSQFTGHQGLDYTEGITAQSVQSKALCMNAVTIPSGTRANAHLHEDHESAIFVISGEAEMWFGDQLEEHVTVQAGDFLYIPAGVPHVPANRSGAPCVAVLARTDPNEQESVTLLPELDHLVPWD